VLTFNEAPNLARTLAALSWARRVVVLDSGSTDDSREIAARFPNVDWQVRAFDDHASQCNHALDHLLAGSRWVLFMDADYIVTPELRAEMEALQPDDRYSGYDIPFRYCVDGIPLRGTLYPSRVCLFRPERGRYRQFGHTQWLETDGPVGALAASMLHDDRKSARNFIARQRRYARLEAEYLWSEPWATMNWRKRVRRLVVIAPWAAPLFALVGKGVILDGIPGLKYAWERAQAEFLIAGALLRQMLAPKSSKS
jgi:glycosyltransferase involved in cell wall biosynthesis